MSPIHHAKKRYYNGYLRHLVLLISYSFGSSELLNIFGTGDGSSVVFYLNGFRHQKIPAMEQTSMLIGISDAESAFDMIYSSTKIKTGQVKYHLSTSSLI